MTATVDPIILTAAVTKLLIIGTILIACLLAPRRSIPILALCILGLAGNLLIADGNPAIAGVVGIASWCVIAIICIRALRQAPEAMQGRLHDLDRENAQLRDQLDDRA